MNPEQILALLQLGEGDDCEFKSAKGGLPHSLWETYSAMANTEGGAIVLGIQENKNGTFEVQGLDDPVKIEKDFWNTLNNQGKVSQNLLQNRDVQFISIGERVVLVIQVPIANRHQRPIFLGQNPLTGTYRRYNDGDHKCNDSEVRRILSDQSEQSADSRILPYFSENDLDTASIVQYRNRLSAWNPSHPWLLRSGRHFLESLGAWRRDRQSGEEGLTAAGILMFGTEETLRSPESGLKFHLDYRERVSNLIADRWADRITPDGTWVPNLFQFFLKVYPKLIDGLKLPFTYREFSTQSASFPDPIRRGMLPIHEAIQESLVNALIHADYHGEGGIVIERFPDRIELSNPGILLVSFEQLLRGAVSECRNTSLQLMFQLLGAGDKAGSGVAKIRQGWATLKWQTPHVGIRFQPDRVILTLPMTSLLPEDSIARLQNLEGYDQLSGNEVAALVTADIEGVVTNERLQQFSMEHKTDLTKMLQRLVAKGFLTKNGYGRWANYQIANGGNSVHNGGNSTHNGEDSIHNGGNSIRNDGNSVHNGGNSIHNAEDSVHNGGNSIRNGGNSIRNGGNSIRNGGNSIRNGGNSIRNGGNSIRNGGDILQMIAMPAREKARLDKEKMREIILQLCEKDYLTITQIGLLMHRDANRLRSQFIQSMVKKQELIPRHAELNHPQQAYKTNPNKRAT